jgi:L-malate glycosyltransferase
LKILYCSENFCPHDHRFLTALAKTDHEIHWFRLSGANNVQEQRDIPSGIRFVEWPALKSKITWMDYFHLKRKFKNVVEKIKPDLIHAGPIQTVALLPALVGFHPLISMSWGFDMLEDANRNWFWKAITTFVLGKSDWLFADCQTVKNMAIKFGFPEENITVFPWGVDLDHFVIRNQAETRQKLELKDDFIIIHTRSWEPRYGVDVALRGFQKAARSNPFLKMIMLSGGSQKDEIQKFVEQHDLTKQVLFYGYQKNEDLAAFYQAADMYLSASHVDGSSVALMESMACGCPGLVSDIPSNLEWITDGVEGWTFKDGDADDLAKKIETAVQYRDDLASLGSAARRKTEEKANWDKNVKKFVAVYQVFADNMKSSKETGEF